jgi:hypothetical protein
MTEPIDPNVTPTYAEIQYQALPVSEHHIPLASHRRRNVLIAVLVTVVAIASTIGGYLVFTVGDPAAQRLAIPDSFDGYLRLTNGNADRLENSMRAMIGGVASGMKGTLDSSAIGVYSRNSGDTPRLVVLAMPGSAMAQASGSGTPMTDQVLALVGPSARTFPPGPHGGESTCGTLTFGTVEETMCAWSDSATAGVMVSVITPMTPARLAAIENDFRDKVD